MFASGLLLLVSTTAGILHFIPRMGILLISAANEVTVNGQTFTRVEEELTWDGALKYCRVHHTDLADLQSLNGVKSIVNLYSILKSKPAWIGLFFDVETGTLSWSIPNMQAAHCTNQHPFICYYDPAIGHLGTTKSPFSDPLKPGEVQIGDQTFIRISEELKTWPAAHQYCKKYYTDLANLQSVTKGTLLEPITSKNEAWIGLIFDVKSQSLKWSSDFGSKIPAWLLLPMLTDGLCASLSRFEHFLPRVTSAVCSALKPFICFYDPNSGHLDPMKVPLTSASLFPQSHEVSTPLTPAQLGTTWSPSFDSGSSIARAEGTLTAPPLPPGNSTAADCTTTTGQELSTVTGHMPPASPQPTGSPSRLKAVTSQASSSGSGNMISGMPIPPLTSTSRPTTRLGPTRRQPEPEPGSFSATGTSQGLLASTEPPGSPLSPGSGNSIAADCTDTTGQELSTVTGHMPPASPQPTGSPSRLKTVTSQASSSGSGNMTPGMPIPPLTSTSRSTIRLGPTRRQPEPEPGSISVTGTSQGLLASTEPPGSPLSPGSAEKRFVILKADFNSPAALEPEDRKEQFLREIQEAVKMILGHEQFRLKWIGSEVKEN